MLKLKDTLSKRSPQLKTDIRKNINMYLVNEKNNLAQGNFSVVSEWTKTIFGFLKKTEGQKEVSPISSEEDFGVVISVGDGIVRVHGLSQAKAGEVLYFIDIFSGEKIYGIALNLEWDAIGVVLLGNDRSVKEGVFVYRTYDMFQVPVGPKLIGAIVDALGNSLNNSTNLNSGFARPRYVEMKAPGIMPRKSVNEPMRTGLKAIDSMIPVGRGQRELIIGDRQTGKTTIAIDTIILNKPNKQLVLSKNLFSVYVAVGQKRSTVVHLARTLIRRNAFEFCTIVSATASDSAALQYLAPYSGCAIGE